MPVSRPIRSVVLSTFTGMALILSATSGCDSESSQAGSQKADPSVAPSTSAPATTGTPKKTPKAAVEAPPKVTQ